MKNWASIWPNSYCSEHLLWWLHILIQKSYILNIHCSTIYNRQDLLCKNRWLDNETIVHIHNRMLLNDQKSEIMQFAIMRMELESIMQSELSQRIKIELWHIKKLSLVINNQQKQQKHFWKRVTREFPGKKLVLRWLFWVFYMLMSELSLIICIYYCI